MKEKYLVRIDKGPWKEVKRSEYEAHLKGSGVEFKEKQSLRGKTFQNGYLEGKVSVKPEQPKEEKRKANP